MASALFSLRRVLTLLSVIAAFALFASYAPRLLDPTKPDLEKRRRDSRWVASSPYWLDRQACRWLSLCGVMHLRWDPPYLPSDNHSTAPGGDAGDLRLDLRRWDQADEAAMSGASPKQKRARPESQKDRARQLLQLKEIPQYVLDHAPLVHLSSNEHFWPSDIAEHIRHLSPNVDNEPLEDAERPTLGSLGRLSRRLGLVSLKSDDDVETRPEWLHSRVGTPEPFERPPQMDGSTGIPGGKDGSLSPPRDGTTWWDVNHNTPLHRISDPRHTPHARRSDDNSTASARPEGFSPAPAVLVLVPKGPGIVDAFWFFFYSYNLGQTVLGLRFGNHVGDWEHCMIRFEDGVPRGMFLSEHEGGQAYAFNALEQYARFPGRPVVFAAVGSHAMYALPGKHPYVLPFGMLADETDRGPLWDVSLNQYAYWYEYEDGGDDDGGDDDGDDDDDGDGGGNGNPDRRVDGEEGSYRSEWGGDQKVLSARRNDDDAASLAPTASNPDAPTSWFHYEGIWGDDLYPLADQRQWRLFSQYHYVPGPQGPKAKNLGRAKMCQTLRCRILTRVDPNGKWY